MILLPEFPVDLERVVQSVVGRHERGGVFTVIVVAEGTKLKREGGEPQPVVLDAQRDEFGNVRLGGVADKIVEAIAKQTGFDCRAVRLGHIQRGGSPSAYDRVLATRYGIVAVEMIRAGEFGKMAALRGTKIETVPLDEVARSTKTVDPELYEIAEVFFG